MNTDHREKRAGLLDDQGSSMIYVILFITLLSVFSCGYMALSRYNLRSALSGRSYMEAQLTAKTIHRSFCEAVSSGQSDAMNEIWRCFEQDCDEIREEYDEMMADSEEEDDAAEEEWEPLYGDDRGRTVREPEDHWERYLYHALGDKEYVMKGSQSLEDKDLEVDITLAARPLDEEASVHTEVVCNGYAFSMGADIVFDDSDGAVMTIESNRYRRSSGALEIRLNGNGVRRYYEYD